MRETVWAVNRYQMHKRHGWALISTSTKQNARKFSDINHTMLRKTFIFIFFFFMIRNFCRDRFGWKVVIVLAPREHARSVLPLFHLVVCYGFIRNVHSNFGTHCRAVHIKINFPWQSDDHKIPVNKSINMHISLRIERIIFCRRHRCC